MSVDFLQEMQFHLSRFGTVMGLSPAGWLLLILANIPVYFFLAWVWFRDIEGFGDAIKFWLTPEAISLFRGEYGEDRWAEFKLVLWLLSCGVCVYFEADFIQYLMSRGGP